MFMKFRLLVICLTVYLGACLSIFGWEDWTVFPGCMKNGEQYGVRPKDPYFLESQALVIECFTENRFKNLAFIIGEHKADDKYVWQNGTYAILQIPRITTTNITKIANANIICQDTSSEACIDNAFLQLDYYPKEPRNIRCLVYNFDTLRCTWDLGVDYIYPQHVNVKCQFAFNVSTKFKINPTAENWTTCPNGSDTWCFWDSSNYHNSLVILLKITVTNMKYNITREKNVEIHRDDVLKPGKVKKLSVLHKDDPSCVTLMWHPPYTFRNFTYKITYSSVCEEKKGIAHHACKDSWCSYTLCRLNPFTNYSLDIISRYSPYWEERGFWSNVTSKVFITDKTRPARNPISTEGLYQYEYPYLTLYWLPLGFCELHSDDTVYIVSLQGTTKAIRSSEFRLETKLQIENTSLDSFNISIHAENSEGRAAGQYVMKIIDEKYGPPDSELIIEYIDNGTDCKEYYATIKMNPQTKFVNITHTIIWCQVETGATTICMEPWHVLEDVSEIFAVRIDVTNYGGTYTFGLITKGFKKHSWKRTWTDINIVNCIYPYNNVPKEPLPNIHLSKVMLPNTVTVEWQPYPCGGEEPVGYIENYIVTYCETREPDTQETCDCVKQRKEIKVSNDRSSYTVEDLESNLPVCVWVSANTSAGVGPKNLKPLFHKVGQGEDTLHPILVIAPSLGGVALIVLLVILFNRCKARFKQWMRELRRIEIPIDSQVTEETPMVEPKESQYPLVNDANNKVDDFDYSDEDTHTVYEDMDSGLDGYFNPKEVVSTSNNSVNSDLSLHDGRVCINGQLFTVKAKRSCHNSMEFLVDDSEYVTQIQNDDIGHTDSGEELPTGIKLIPMNEGQQTCNIHDPVVNEIDTTTLNDMMKKLRFNVDQRDREETGTRAILNADNLQNINECESELDSLLRGGEQVDEEGIMTNEETELKSLLVNYKSDGGETEKTLLKRKDYENHQSDTNINDEIIVSKQDNYGMDSMPYLKQTEQNTVSNTNDYFQCDTNNTKLKTDQFYSSNQCMDGYTDSPDIQDSNIQINEQSLPQNSIPNRKTCYHCSSKFDALSQSEVQDYYITGSKSSQELECDSSGTDHLDDHHTEIKTDGDQDYFAINQDAMTFNNSVGNSEILVDHDSSSPDFVLCKTSSHSDYVTVSTQDRTVPQILNQTTDDAISGGDKVQISIPLPRKANSTQNLDKSSVSESDIAHSIVSEIISLFIYELIQEIEQPESTSLSIASKTEPDAESNNSTLRGSQTNSSKQKGDTVAENDKIADMEISERNDSSHCNIGSSDSTASGSGASGSTPSYVLSGIQTNSNSKQTEGTTAETEEKAENQCDRVISGVNEFSNSSINSSGSAASGSGTSGSAPSYVLMPTLEIQKPDILNESIKCNTNETNMADSSSGQVSKSSI